MLPGMSLVSLSMTMTVDKPIASAARLKAQYQRYMAAR